MWITLDHLSLFSFVFKGIDNQVFDCFIKLVINF